MPHGAGQQKAEGRQRHPHVRGVGVAAEVVREQRPRIESPADVGSRLLRSGFADGFSTTSSVERKTSREPVEKDKTGKIDHPVLAPETRFPQTLKGDSPLPLTEAVAKTRKSKGPNGQGFHNVCFPLSQVVIDRLRHKNSRSWPVVSPLTMA